MRFLLLSFFVRCVFYRKKKSAQPSRRDDIYDMLSAFVKYTYIHVLRSMRIISLLDSARLCFFSFSFFFRLFYVGSRFLPVRPRDSTHARAGEHQRGTTAINSIFVVDALWPR